MHSIIRATLISSLLLYGIVASSSESIHFALRDSVGNLIKTIDTSNKVVSSYRYTPYGLSSSAIPQVEESEFTGQTCSSVTGLCDFSHRHYDPVTARFLTPDPEHEFSSPYSYTSRPKTFTDPSGLWFENIEGVIASVRQFYRGTRDESVFDDLRVRLEKAKKEYDVAKREAQAARVQAREQGTLLKSQGAVSDEASSASPTTLSRDELTVGAIGKGRENFLGFVDEQREHLINTYYVDRKFQDPNPPLFYSNRALKDADLINIALIKARFWGMSREELASAGQLENCTEVTKCVIDYLKTGEVKEARPGKYAGLNGRSDHKISSFYDTRWLDSAKDLYGEGPTLSTSTDIKGFFEIIPDKTITLATTPHNDDPNFQHIFVTYKDDFGNARVLEPNSSNFFSNTNRSALRYIRLSPVLRNNFMAIDFSIYFSGK